VHKWCIKLLRGLFRRGSYVLSWVHHRLPVPKATSGSHISFSFPVCSRQEQGLGGSNEVSSHRCLPVPCHLLCLWPVRMGWAVTCRACPVLLQGPTRQGRSCTASPALPGHHQMYITTRTGSYSTHSNRNPTSKH